MAGDAIWLVLVLAFGTVLHPELKAFYHHHSGMKNTVSAIDTICACVFLSLRGRASQRPWWEKLRWATPPGLFVFVVISLSTWANALSYQTFALSAPAELVFVWAFGLRQAENRKLWRRDLPSVLVTTCGAVLLHLDVPSRSPTALFAALLCRAAQALMTVTLRGCCLALGPEDGKEPVSIVEITQWKLLVTSSLCLPYAFLTEGLAPWSALVSSSFWTDSSSLLLLGSVAITLGFQWSTVGMNRSFRSPLCALLQSTLQPLTSCVLVLILADSSWRDLLGLKTPQTAWDVAGLGCLVIGLLSIFTFRSLPSHAESSVEFLDRRSGGTASA